MDTTSLISIEYVLINNEGFMKKLVVKIVASVLIVASIGLNAWFGIASALAKWKQGIEQKTTELVVGQIVGAVKRDGKVIFTLPEETITLIPYVVDQKPR